MILPFTWVSDGATTQVMMLILVVLPEGQNWNPSRRDWAAYIAPSFKTSVATNDLVKRRKYRPVDPSYNPPPEEESA